MAADFPREKRKLSGFIRARPRTGITWFFSYVLLITAVRRASSELRRWPSLVNGWSSLPTYGDKRLLAATLEDYHVLYCCSVTKSCPTLLRDFSLPGFSVCGISQARILELGCYLRGFYNEYLGSTLDFEYWAHWKHNHLETTHSYFWKVPKRGEMLWGSETVINFRL